MALTRLKFERTMLPCYNLQRRWLYFAILGVSAVIICLESFYSLIHHGDFQPEANRMVLSPPETTSPSSVDASKSQNTPAEHPSNTQDPTNIIQSADGTIAMDTWLAQLKQRKKPPNVLFIIADDMRPEIGAYVHKQSPWLEPSMATPHLDSLASGGLLFRRAYCQFSWCNPSRSSFLTSRRPDTTMVHNNSVFFRENNPNFVSLPQYFKQNGYLTLGMGKVFHLLSHEGDHDSKYSWSIPFFQARAEDILQDGDRTWEAIDERSKGDKPMLDEEVNKFAMKRLTRVAHEDPASRKPFFIAVGYKKPHLNWYFRAKFMDHYSLKNISAPANPAASLSLPGIAWFRSFEIRGKKEYKNYTDIWGMTQPLPDMVIREMRRAYYSTISYIDDLIGQLLQHLQDLGLADDTIVSFIGDHGFHLGEHSIVGKNTAFEVANNAPMIIRIPGVTNGGLVTDKLVEFVDLFPTLAELAGLPTVPYCPSGNMSRTVKMCTEGTSIVPLFKDPTTTKWKDRVFYQYPHYLGHGEHFCMGYSMRTEQYRYTEWVHYNYDAEVKANWTDICATELYDHHVDPHETNNIADDIMLKETQQELSRKIKAGWLAALPK